MISSNSFSKKSFTKSSGLSSRTFTKGSGFVSRTFTKGTEVWGGENLSGGNLAGDIFGGPDSTFGIGEFGGISHSFAVRGSVSH